MIRQSKAQKSVPGAEIIYVDWPLARWARNVSYRPGLRMLPYRSEEASDERHRMPVLSGRFPDGGTAA